jgi:hypothetical protein
MANWKAEIDIRERWAEVQDDEAPIADLIDDIISKLKLLQRKNSTFKADDELTNFIEQFEELLNSDDDDEDEKKDSFDAIWEEFYNWADDDHKLWIRTV